jgi:hypothetical protein
MIHFKEIYSKIWCVPLVLLLFSSCQNILKEDSQGTENTEQQDSETESENPPVVLEQSDVPVPEEPNPDSIKEAETRLAELEKRITETNSRLKKIQRKDSQSDLESAASSASNQTSKKKEKNQPKISYSNSLNVKLYDESVVWRPVGQGNYDISIVRAVDNALVFSTSTPDTNLAYAAMELDESIRYNLKVTHNGRRLMEKKSFSLIGKGTQLNPTCK